MAPTVAGPILWRIQPVDYCLITLRMILMLLPE